MSKSVLFSPEVLTKISDNILSLLNSAEDFENARVADSPRAVGDTVQSILGIAFEHCVPPGLVYKFSGDFARRAMADFAFYDIEENYFVVDIKTHNKNTVFNMPNLTSVERLARFYEDDKNFFTLLIVEYTNISSKVTFEKCVFAPIEHLDWSCLTLGALGWGQLQIANANNIVINRENTRRKWMLELCGKLDHFYPNEIKKINERILRFQNVRDFWENH